MAELAAVREPGWLKERRSDAARRAKLLDCLRIGACWPDGTADRLTELVAGVAALPQARTLALAMGARP